MAVTRCLCRDLTFEQLKAVADAERLDLDALKSKTGCCEGCGMCEPYVRLMLLSGETKFRVLTGAALGKFLKDHHIDRSALTSVPIQSPQPQAAQTQPG